MRVVLLDPSSENVNAGDEVIFEAIARQGLTGVDSARRLTTHRTLNWSERRAVSQADVALLCGTNILSSHMERHRQWLIDPDLARRLTHKVVLCGVGWWQYQEEPCRYTRWLLRHILSRRLPHSVRDRYTEERLRHLGVDARYTACPTMWGLPVRDEYALPMAKGAVVTVTDYKQAIEIDRRWIHAVTDAYDEVTAIGMGPGDRAYWDQLGIQGVNWGGQGTAALAAATEQRDFVGTRLHAGIHAMQAGQSGVILAVDNRASEIGTSTGMSVVGRDDLDGLSAILDGSRPVHPPQLPVANIQSWMQAWQEQVTSSA